ncbi:unnamed protein product, partial [Mesorhabditis belari]|uniref:Uncharacterized protein n=1 Tax=Mesorhabditis belari TaxID=2138241 RepID=A0AAF3J9S5_9BILA
MTSKTLFALLVLFSISVSILAESYEYERFEGNLQGSKSLPIRGKRDQNAIYSGLVVVGSFVLVNAIICCLLLCCVCGGGIGLYLASTKRKHQIINNYVSERIKKDDEKRMESLDFKRAQSTGIRGLLLS